MTTIHEMAAQVQNRTGITVTNKSIVSALGLTGKTTGRTVLPDEATIEVVIAALAKTNPLLAPASAAPADPPAPTSDATPPMVDVTTTADAEIFFDDGLGLKPAAVLATDLQLPIEAVLVYAEVQNGDGTTMVNPATVQKNLAAIEAAEDLTASDRPAGNQILPRNLARSAMLTSDNRHLGAVSTRIIRGITTVAIRLQECSVDIHNGTAFRPELTIISRVPATGERMSTTMSEVPKGNEILFCEYESPLRKRWMVRIRPNEYLRLMLNPTESFPLYSPVHFEELLAELASTDLVTLKCGACGQFMDPLLKSKLEKVLNGEHYLRDQGRRAKSALAKLGYPVKAVTEIRFKQNHEECNELLKRMQTIVAEMHDRDFNDPDASNEFLGRVLQEVGEVMATLRAKNPRSRPVEKKLILVRARDIVKRLESHAA